MAERHDGRSRPAWLTRRRVAGGLLLGGVAVVASSSTPPSRVLAQAARDRVVVLPPPDPALTLTLAEALATRHSVREFEDRTPSVEQVGQLLWAAQGVTHGSGGRTAPSAGALYPLDVYAVTRGTLWHHLPDGHRAEQWDAPATLAAELGDAAFVQVAVSSAPLIVVITGTTRRTSGKYGFRAPRYVTLEAGHCAQNVLLQAVALGLGAVPVGGFADDAVRHRLGLRVEQTPYYLVSVGTPRAGAG